MSVEVTKVSPGASPSKTKAAVKEYYGQTLESSKDLQTDACCTEESVPDYVKPFMSKIHDEVMTKYYGCGVVVPECLEGASVLDLGSGSGRDAYMLSGLVGESGHVVGVDMTQEQLDVANRHKDHMAEAFGFSRTNMTFLKGDIESLSNLGLEPKSFDCVISNCVVNLAENKKAVLEGAFDLLKEGGEFYFSDVYASRRVPEELTQDPVLYGECLSGALYWNDFLNLAKEVGFSDPRKVVGRELKINAPEIKSKLGNIKFYSITYRLFKISSLEPDCEDYGQMIKYKGSAPFYPHSFALDGGHVFEKGRLYPVCGNSFDMLHKTRFKEHFEFYGDTSVHYGVFEGCGSKEAPSFGESAKIEESGTCC